MKKMTFVTGVGLGYVLGSRAGRQRYEQLKSRAQGVWQSPKVQGTVTQAQDFAAQKAPGVQQKITASASQAKHKVTGMVSERVGSSSESEAGSGYTGSMETNPGPPAGFAENPAKN